MSCLTCGKNHTVQPEECTPAPTEDQWEYTYELVSCTDSAFPQETTEAGWKPFSATPTYDQSGDVRIWLRRKKP